MLNAEDDLNDTIMTSLDAMGGDDTMFYYIKGTKIQNPADAYERQFAFDTDMDALIQKAREIPDLGLIIFDPIQNYIGDTDHNSDADMRKILSRLSDLANELGICIITVQHLNSREKVSSPLHKVMGAKALHAVARFVYIVGPDDSVDSRDKYHHILTQARGATGSVPSLRYHTVLDERNVGQQTLQAIRIEWDGPCEATAEDAINPASANEKVKAVEFGSIIRELLQDGPKTANECYQKLKEAGWEGHDVTSTSVIKKKAKAESKIIDGKWYWFLPEKMLGNHNDIHREI
jgi:hypothetical protein